MRSAIIALVLLSGCSVVTDAELKAERDQKECQQQALDTGYAQSTTRQTLAATLFAPWALPKTNPNSNAQFDKRYDDCMSDRGHQG